MDIFPFAALRPADGLASRIASLPYDVMDTAEARRMAAGNPLSFLHVVRSEIDLPEGADPAAPAVYETAKKNLDALVAEGRLVREAEPALYLYRQTMGAHAQTAVVACCAAADYANGTILRHEKTRKDKEDDRTNHILATRAHTGQVFLCYRDEAAIDALVAAETAAPPLLDFVAEDGIAHAVWRAKDPAALAAAFRAVPKAYIADGHHRSAASFRAAEALRAEGGESQRFMACLFPASQLAILPYHRSGLPAQGAGARLLGRGDPRADAAPGPFLRGAAGGGLVPALVEPDGRAGGRPGRAAGRLAPAGGPARAGARHRRPAHRPAHLLHGRHPRHGRTGARRGVRQGSRRLRDAPGLDRGHDGHRGRRRAHAAQVDLVRAEAALRPARPYVLARRKPLFFG